VAQVADPAAGRLTRAPGAFGLPNPTRCQSRIPRRSPRRAGGRGDEAGVHPSEAWQSLLSGRRPGQRRVVQVVVQLQHDAGDLGRVQLEPGMPESQAGELPGAQTSPLAAAPTPRPAASN
jgi:hypothetical protein